MRKIPREKAKNFNLNFFLCILHYFIFPTIFIYFLSYHPFHLFFAFLFFPYFFLFFCKKNYLGFSFSLWLEFFLKKHFSVLFISDTSFMEKEVFSNYLVLREQLFTGYIMLLLRRKVMNEMKWQIEIRKYWTDISKQNSKLSFKYNLLRWEQGNCHWKKSMSWTLQISADISNHVMVTFFDMKIPLL